MRFLITGDSWSQGEWDGYPTDYRITHSGIQQYLLEDKHEVYNVGQGGYNNLESLAAAKNFNHDFDHLIFFYTDPLRQAKEYDIKHVLPFVLIQDHIKLLINNLIVFKQEKQCKITVIGGCAKFNVTNNDIDYIIPSINEFLVSEFVDSEFMTSREWEEHFFKHEKNFNLVQKAQWLTVMTEAEKKYKLWSQHKEYFWPDGLHVNRHGAFKLYQSLFKLWF
jgi:hypothetical protein